MSADGSRLIREMERLRDAGGVTYVLDLVNLLKTIPIDTPCEQTGVTPLMWAIESDFLFSFCLTQGPNVNAHGNGEYDLTPMEFALVRGRIEMADTLARWGAECPPEVATHRQGQRDSLRRRRADIQNIQDRLNHAISDGWFVSELDGLSKVFGVKSKRVQGRQGHVSFKNVRLKQLSSAENESTEDWFAALHARYADKGISLFTREPLGWRASLEVCATPTIAHRELLTVSSLLSNDGGDESGERIVVAEKLEDVHSEAPFHILSCGRRGILIRFIETPNQPESLAKRLGEIAPELHWQCEAANDVVQADKTTGSVNTLAIIAAELKVDPFVFLPWE